MRQASSQLPATGCGTTRRPNRGRSILPPRIIMRYSDFVVEKEQTTPRRTSTAVALCPDDVDIDDIVICRLSPDGLVGGKCRNRVNVRLPAERRLTQLFAAVAIDAVVAGVVVVLRDLSSSESESTTRRSADRRIYILGSNRCRSSTSRPAVTPGMAAAVVVVTASRCTTADAPVTNFG